MAAEEYDDEREEAAMRAEGRRRFTTHIIRKTPTAGHGHALGWGWCYKKGQGGLLHRGNWKRRFVTLFRVPQGHVLVYYDKKTIDVMDLQGFIDLRKATALNEDTAKVSGTTQRVIQVVTAARTFHICPQSINSEIRHGIVERVQHILGWPVPEPTFGHEIDVETGDPDEVFERWMELLGSSVKTEQEVEYFDAEVVADSTESLPTTVSLRIAPTNFVCLDAEDDSVAITCTTYDQIESWKAPRHDELHITLSSAATGGAPGRVIFRIEDAFAAKACMEGHVRRILSHVKEPPKAAPVSGGAGAGDDDEFDMGPPDHAPPDEAEVKAKRDEAEATAAAEAEEHIKAQAESKPDEEDDDDAPPPPPEAKPKKKKKKRDYSGWATYTDKASGRKYYANKATGQTSWVWPPPDEE